MSTHSKVRLFKIGNQKAYQKIFDKLYPVMCSFAVKYLRNSDDAEDITQEVFIELWNQREKFSDINQIKGFLYLSVKNKCLNKIKHEKVKTEYANDIRIIEDDIYFEEQLIKIEVISQLHSTINSLSKQRREIILYIMQGLKNNEIAEELNISVNTVKLQKKIAYQKLREELKSSVFTLSIILSIV